MQKDELRKKYLKIRDEQSDSLLDKEIIRRLTESAAFKNASCVMCYVSFRSEVGTHELIKKMISDEVRVCVPKIIKNDIYAYEIKSFSDLSPGAYGILEPTEQVPVSKDKIDLCIVPGIAAFTNRHRIGYGKGFYDRFLTDFTGVSAGLFYDFCVIDSDAKYKRDVKLDMIVTASKIIS